MCNRSVCLVLIALGLIAVPSTVHAQVVNLVNNHSFEEDEVILDDPSWTSWCTWGDGDGLGSTVAFDDTESVDGARSLRITPTGTVNWHFILLHMSMPMEVNRSYTASFWVKAEAPRSLTAKFKAVDNSVDWAETSFQLTTEWAEYSMTSAALNHDVKLEIFCSGSTVPFWLDFVYVYEGDYVAGITPAGAPVPTKAMDPIPADDADDVPRDVVLTWAPGVFSATHDVYFGTSLADVENASRANPGNVLVSQGQTVTTYDPPGLLDFDTTYYWRVDEVNSAPDFAIFTGDVWSFTTEPVAYPVESIVASSNGISEEEAGPENTVDGSGLDEADQHSVDSADMWLADAPEDEDLYIQYEFDRIYKLHEMLVWNYNVQFEPVLGFGVKDATIEYSENGQEWVGLGDVELNQATARSTYTYNTTVDLQGVAARFVRLNVNSAFGTTGQYGLSEVRFMYIPAHAREPQPADGAMDVSVDSTLAWRAGRDAVSHEVYFGTDPNALDLASTVSGAGYAPGALNLGATYYWQVNAVQEAESWAGDLWSFATQEYLVVDDFESYTDDIDAGEAIFDTWFDGWVNDTGSTVGHLQSPFAEQIIVRSGSQSMPLFYDNTEAAVSEADLELAADWTTNGIRSLSLYFYGAAGNTGQLYVKINGIQIRYDGDADDITRAAWQPWNIDLSAIGNVSNVRSLTIGIEGADATGLLYIDDIRLYPKEVEYVTPVEPDTADLVAYYAFDGDLNDASGNGYHGVANGDVAYGAGVEGQAVQLNGTDAYVSVAGVGITGAAPRTIAGWAKADTTGIPAWTNVFGFTGGSVDGQHFDIQAVGDTGTTTLGYYGLHRHGWEQDILPIDLEWHHLAATFDGTAVSWYGDGRPIGSVEVDNVDTPGEVRMGNRQDNDNFFPGSVDEVRIYDRALSDGEIAWLAGKTEPIHTPF